MRSGEDVEEDAIDFDCSDRRAPTPDRRGDVATAYVCEGYICKLPTTDVAVFAEQIALSPD